ncbi:P-loop NTPase fold protein, partial [Rheinheimera sp.]|uniref:P-loop NTPase fold protein n=1 Tax=Rheinheimera sp. TaxID=1869214 RepID=UPI002626B5EF
MKGMMIKRYLDLLLYSIIAYLVLSFIGEITIGETTIWKELLTIQKKLHCSTCDALTLHFLTQIVLIAVGMIISSLASHFQIYHPNRPVWPNLRFPPLTFSVCFAVLYWSFQSQQQFIALMANGWGLIVGLLILPVLHFIHGDPSKNNSNSNLKNSRNGSDEKPKRSDDVPIECIKDLDEELKPLAESLTSKLKGDSRHIAVCGAFGTGKSSIIKSAINKLEEDQKGSWIHCNIELWGIATHSIVEFVLEQITLALADHLDISSLRRLPANYLEAIKTSNTSWSFLASLLDKHESPDQVLKQIDEMLRLINKKLIVTVQDIDRNENRQSSMAELAALLERLKQSVENITYIFAAERTTGFETIRRVCPVRLDLAKPTLTNEIKQLHKELVAALPERYLSILSGYELAFTESEAAMIADLLPSYRAFNEL